MSIQMQERILEDIKGEINSNTIIIGAFNTPLTSLDNSSKQKINNSDPKWLNRLDETN